MISQRDTMLRLFGVKIFGILSLKEREGVSKYIIARDFGESIVIEGNLTTMNLCCRRLS